AVVEGDGVVSFANAALGAMVGRTVDEIRDAPFLDLIDPADDAAVRLRMRDASQWASSLAPLGVRLRHAGRRRTTADVTFRPLWCGPRCGEAADVPSCAAGDAPRAVMAFAP